MVAKKCRDAAAMVDQPSRGSEERTEEEKIRYEGEGRLQY